MQHGCGKDRHPATRNKSPDVLLIAKLVFVVKRIDDGKIDGHPSCKRVNQTSSDTAIAVTELMSLRP